MHDENAPQLQFMNEEFPKLGEKNLMKNVW